ncbi:MAG: Hsp20/alpha crystallin family protein [Deltaproteobacteria bacterium]|jgi:HSP20 family protein|nr:Hsp20/alpha crystallin family protein [Deltaproteobacteria bacterium]
MLFLRRDPNWRALSNWSPFDELNRIRREMDLLSDGISRGVARGAGVFPLINLTEDKDAYYIRAELPGMKADDIELSVNHDSITLSGERKIVNEDKNAKYHRRERESGKFNRILTLPGQVDIDKAEASNVNGVLAIRLPKSEAAKPRQITIK